MANRLTCCKWCTAKRRKRCCGICGAISIILTIFFTLALAFNLTDELFFLAIKKVCIQTQLTGLRTFVRPIIISACMHVLVWRRLFQRSATPDYACITRCITIDSITVSSSRFRGPGDVAVLQLSRGFENFHHNCVDI